MKLKHKFNFSVSKIYNKRWPKFMKMFQILFKFKISQIGILINSMAIHLKNNMDRLAQVKIVKSTTVEDKLMLFVTIKLKLHLVVSLNGKGVANKCVKDILNIITLKMGQELYNFIVDTTKKNLKIAISDKQVNLVMEVLKQTLTTNSL